MGIADFMFAPKQQKLLATLLLHPDKSYSFNDLLRKSGAGRGSGQRELNRLIEAGIAKDERVSNLRQVRINRDFPLYEEIRSICLKTFGLRERLSDALAPVADTILLAFIFGSVANNTDHADSDIDLLLVSDTDGLVLNGIFAALEERLSRPIHLLHYGKDDWEAAQQQPILRKILEGNKIMVISND